MKDKISVFVLISILFIFLLFDLKLYQKIQQMNEKSFNNDVSIESKESMNEIDYKLTQN
jgi:cell division protein YceG involved in septum cleavage